LGLSLDYWIHLYVAAAARGIPDGFRERLAVAREAFRELFPALAIGAASTSGAFLVLTLSHYPVVRHLGALGATAAAAALLGTWLLGPLTWAVFGARPLSHVAPVRGPAWARPVFLGVTALAVLFAMDTSFDGDPRNLVRISGELQRVEQVFSSRYGGFGTGGMVVVEGPGEQTLDDAARVQVALGKVPGVDAVGAGALVPGPETRSGRRAALPDEGVLQERVERAGAEVGFTQEALAGVAARIHAAPAQPLSAETWAGTPLGPLVDRHLQRDGDQVAAMISLVVGDETLVEPIEAVVSQVAPHAEIVLPARLATRGMEELLAEIRRMGLLSVVGVLLLLLLRYRDPRRVVAALVPCGAALAWAFGAMALLGVSWNAVSIAALVLILGLGLDYGVFVLEGTLRRDRGISRRAVLLSALTTIAGFGILGVTRSPALFGVGLAVLVGLGAAAAAALVVVPPLAASQPLLPTGVARWTRRVALVALVLLNLEVLGLLLAYSTPPPPGKVPDWRLEEPTPGDRRWGPNRLLYRQGIWSEYLVGDPYVRGYASGLLGADLQARLERETHAALREHVPMAAARWAVLRATLLLAPRLDRTFTPAQRPVWRRPIRGASTTTPSTTSGRRWWTPRSSPAAPASWRAVQPPPRDTGSSHATSTSRGARPSTGTRSWSSYAPTTASPSSLSASSTWPAWSLA
ncbi:MAG: hypothetical protein JRJ84_25665, partial [Deltaproteobacteria bacterium]|nr:hypothetical protein [Deltaproteobacteria bacterium]